MPSTTTTVSTLSFAVAVLVPVLAATAWATTERALDRIVARTVSRLELPPPAGGAAALRGRFRRRHRAAGVGAATGLALVLAWGWVSDDPFLERSGAAVPVLLVAAMVGVAVGTGLLALREAANARPADGPRLARPVTPTIADYVPPIERLGARVVVAVPAVVLVTAAVTSLAGVVDLAALVTGTPALLYVVAAPAVAFVAEAASRRLLERPQPAASPVELAWSDASRAQVLRDIVTVPLLAGMFATAGVTAAALEATAPGGPSDLVIAVGTAVAGLLVLAALVTAAVSASSRPDRHFRRRLWSDEASLTATGDAPR